MVTPDSGDKWKRATAPQRSQLFHEISSAINCVSREGVSNTPDFILARYLTRCLAAFEEATVRREEWHGNV